MSVVSRWLVAMYWVVDDVKFRRVRYRLAGHLPRGTEPPGEPAVDATHAPLAAGLAASPEAVSRRMEDLEHARRVRIAQKRIQRIDRPVLEHSTRDQGAMLE